MSIKKGIVATTHVDLQRELLTKNALEQMVNQYRTNYIKVMDEHDPRKIPIGRVIDGRLVELQDGEFAVEATFELFDGSDPQADEKGKELNISDKEDEEDLTIYYDYSYRKKAHINKIEEFNRKIAHHTGLRYFAKKSLEPLSILTIGGVFILGKIAEGFLHKAGEETFTLLKKQLPQLLLLPTRKRERVLELRLVVKNGDLTHQVSLYLSNPTEKEIDLVLDKGLKKLDDVLPKYVSQGAKEIALSLKDNKFEVIYMLNGKARPFVPLDDFRIIDIEI
jgi:hypothetical protein